MPPGTVGSDGQLKHCVTTGSALCPEKQHKTIYTCTRINRIMHNPVLQPIGLQSRPPVEKCVINISALKSLLLLDKFDLGLAYQKTYQKTTKTCP